MPAIFSKNCILKGELDLYCLVCSTHLPEAEDVLPHIQDSNHKASLRHIPYYEKFKDDLIRKVNGLYFCEVCNKVFATTAKVGIHVAEESHIKGRKRRLTRLGSSIIFQKNTLIEESAWNGLVEDACVICNIEFDDYSTHLSEHSHILKVIKSRVIIDNDDNIYRKMDGGYHCLTCNKIVSDNCITEHLKSTEHTEAGVIVASCQCDHGEEINAEALSSFSPLVDKKKDKKEGSSGIVQEDPETETSISKKSSPGPSLVKDKETPTSPKSVTKEMAIFAKQHGMTVNKIDYTVYCNVCSSQVPATMISMKEHVSGMKHKDNHRKQSFTSQTKKSIKKIYVKDFITRTGRTINSEGVFIIINDLFHLQAGNYFGFKMLAGKLICQFCHIDLVTENYEAHLKSPVHKSLMDNSYVITSFEKEFVREVKSDLYHCGYCGTVESDMDEMKVHLTTARHKMSREENEKMLRNLAMTELQKCKTLMSLLPTL